MDDPRFQRLGLHVHANLEKPISLAQAASVVGLERTYFSRAFRKLIGCTFSEWIRCVRIERAEELLSSRRITIMSAALAVGYRDLTTFERAFKRCHGVSPKTYRTGSVHE